MQSTDERVTSVRRREQRQNIKTRLLGMVGVCSLVCLVLVLGIVGSGVSTSATTGDALYGASIFGEGVGGYALVAVVSFVAATALTLACLRHRAYRGTSGPLAGKDGNAATSFDAQSASAPVTKER